MRELASIQKIHNIQDIEGKDLLKTANVLGWQLLVHSDNGFKEGDLCIYIEIDSVVPKTTQFAFLEKKNYRIRTMKMAGKLSEGIALPLSFLPSNTSVYEGMDVTEVFGITKYESPSERAEKQREARDNNKRKVSNLRKYVQRYKWGRKYFPIKSKQARRAFPQWISKTDEIRIQKRPYLLTDGNQYTATEKIDGCSATYGIRRIRRTYLKDKYELVICSRNVNLTADTNKKSIDYWGDVAEDSHYFEIARKYGILGRLSNMMNNTNFDSIVLQGEIIGPKIQGNKYHLTEGEIEFYLFNLVVDGEPYHIDYNVGDFKVIQHFLQGVQQVPLCGSLNCYEDNTITIPELQELATFKTTIQQFNPKNADTLAEGLVYRAYDEDSKVISSFKVISPEFLIKNKE